MRAAVFHAPQQPRTIEDVEIEKPKRRETLLHSAYAGLCHSDLHFMEGLYPCPAPAVLGHEGAGVSWSCGDRVA
jgi:S-(hydroxymethyl)glutathione dehydrogenase/alcohol dehydrogenase